MEEGTMRRNSRFSAHDKRALAIGLAILAILLPLYIERGSIPEAELKEKPVHFFSYLPLLQVLLIMAIAVSSFFFSYLPLLQVLLIMAIAVSSFLEHGFTGVDP